MKNCGSSFHQEVANRAFMEELRDLVKLTSNEKLRDKVLELIQAWAHAFRKDSTYRVISDFFNVMKAEGYKFPPLKETDAMFEADSAPQWTDGDSCHRCRVQFNLVQRKHHCRNCGQIFCSKCSNKQAIIPRFGIEKEVRVCDDCFEKLSKPPASGTDPKSKFSVTTTPRNSPARSSLPIEATTKSSPAGGKTEQELQEEEDLQMALALSKSEAEVKEKTRSSSMSYANSFSESSSLSTRRERERERESKSFDNEMEKYLNREYWEARVLDSNRSTSPAPSAPSPHYSMSTTTRPNVSSDDDKPKPSTVKQENGDNSDIDSFISNLKSALEIFVNRMSSNNQRGRPIANDTAVQSMFMNITNMHSHLLKYIQEQDDKRVYFEGLQDKLSQIRDARAALDALREEHQERMRLEAEEAERQRQLQMAQKLEIMRAKKQEYLQYQRQMALQRIQEQEREMMMRQEQKKYQWQPHANQAPQVTSPYARPPINYGPMYGPHPTQMPTMIQSSVTPSVPMGHGVVPGSPSRTPFNGQPTHGSIPPPQNVIYQDASPGHSAYPNMYMTNMNNMNNIPRNTTPNPVAPGQMMTYQPQLPPQVSYTHGPATINPMNLPTQNIMPENGTQEHSVKVEQASNEQPLISFD